MYQIYLARVINVLKEYFLGQYFFLTIWSSDQLEYNFYSSCLNYIDLYILMINKIGFILFSDIWKIHLKKKLKCYLADFSVWRINTFLFVIYSLLELTVSFSNLFFYFLFFSCGYLFYLSGILVRTWLNCIPSFERHRKP